MQIYKIYSLYNIRISKYFTERLRIRRLDTVDMSSELYGDYQNLLVIILQYINV